VELGFQLILDNRVLLCLLQDAIDLIRAQFLGIILEDALAIPNDRRAILDDLKEDVDFAQRQKSSLPLSDRLKDTLTFTRLCLLVVEEFGIDTAWPAGRFSFNTRVFKNVFLRDEPGAESQEAQVQKDAHVDRGGQFGVVTRKEALEVAFCLGSIDPSAKCDLAYTISELLSIIDQRALREHCDVDGKGLHSSREEAEQAAAVYVSAQQHSQETLASHVCVLATDLSLFELKSFNSHL
jgi:hypothetical protein